MLLQMLTEKGTLTFGQSLILSGIGMLVVLMELAILAVMIIVLSKVLGSITGKTAPAAAAPAPAPKAAAPVPAPAAVQMVRIRPMSRIPKGYPFPLPAGTANPVRTWRNPASARLVSCCFPPVLAAPSQPANYRMPCRKDFPATTPKRPSAV